MQRNLYLFSTYFYLEEESVDTSNVQYASIQSKQNNQNRPKVLGQHGSNRTVAIFAIGLTSTNMAMAHHEHQ